MTFWYPLPLDMQQFLYHLGYALPEVFRSAQNRDKELLRENNMHDSLPKHANPILPLANIRRKAKANHKWHASYLQDC